MRATRAEIADEIYDRAGEALPRSRAYVGKDLLTRVIRDDWAPWAADIIYKLPGKYARPVVKRYAAMIRREGQRAANLWLRECVAEALERIQIGHAADDDAIRAEAKRRAEQCARILGPNPNEESYARACTFARWNRIAPPDAHGADMYRGAAGRLSCPLWWRRKLRVRDGRAVETLGRDLNLINRRAQCYASDEAVSRRRQQKARNRALMAAVKAENETGYSTTLEALHDSSNSNPAVKRAELMTRIKGFENYAKEQGHVAEFFTVSCPSKFHRSHAQSGLENPRFCGASPRDAQAYLCRLWARARARLGRVGVIAYGVRIAEPHHEGCPHWHLLLFVAGPQADALSEIIRDEALKEDGNEPGAAKHRFKRETIDPEKGSAVGYIAKYVSKNIDGHALEDDKSDGLFTNMDGQDAARRVDAWASTWGIRQFQQIGGPPVGVWRELRRCDTPAASDVIEAARVAADDGDWAGYVKLQGLKRQRGGAWPVRLHKEEPAKETIDRKTGEVRKRGTLNRYGEALAHVVIGVTDGAMWLCSRLHSWIFSLDPGRSSGPWTRVNNCTEAMT